MNIVVPAGVTVNHHDGLVTAKGPKGEIKKKINDQVVFEQKDGVISFVLKAGSEEKLNLWGLTRTLVANLVEGVSKGYEVKMEIVGVGYKAQPSGKKLILSLGFSHNIEFAVPEGVTIDLDKENKNVIVIKGVDKELLGETAARIRKYRRPEPYKGKGIRYVGERVHRKAGKSGAKVGAK